MGIESKKVTAGSVKTLSRRIGTGVMVAHELLVLAGGDIDMAEKASNASSGLDQCRARIIDARFRRLEEDLI